MFRSSKTFYQLTKLVQALPVAPFNGHREVEIPQPIVNNYPPRPDDVIADLQAQLHRMVASGRRPEEQIYEELPLGNCKTMDEVVTKLCEVKATNVFVIALCQDATLRWTTVDSGNLHKVHTVGEVNNGIIKMAFHQAIIPLLYTSNLTQAVMINETNTVSNVAFEKMCQHTLRIVGRVTIVNDGRDSVLKEEVVKMTEVELKTMAQVWNEMKEHLFFKHLEQPLPQA